MLRPDRAGGQAHERGSGEADAAVADLREACFSDLGSQLMAPLRYAGKHAQTVATMAGSSVLDSRKAKERAEALPKGVPPYQEIGNIAYATIEWLALPHESDTAGMPSEPGSEDVGHHAVRALADHVRGRPRRERRPRHELQRGWRFGRGARPWLVSWHGRDRPRRRPHGGAGITLGTARTSMALGSSMRRTL